MLRSESMKVSNLGQPKSGLTTNEKLSDFFFMANLPVADRWR
jgi:hypothetical protein